MRCPTKKGFRGLTQWSQLAAGTVGPGTVIICARAGVVFNYSLIWSLVLASVLAATLQEATAKLSTASGYTFGQCLRIKYGALYRGLWCWVIAVLVCFGNTLYQSNCFAGGIDSFLAFPEAPQESLPMRMGVCLVYTFFLIVLLALDKDDWVAAILSVIIVLMFGLFLTIVLQMAGQGQLDGIGFLCGFIPMLWDLPDGSTNIIISLVGTTSITFNLFVGGNLAKGKKMREARMGNGFSSLLTFLLSLFILLVGSGASRSKSNNTLNDTINNSFNDTSDIFFNNTSNYTNDNTFNSTFKISMLSEVIKEQTPYWGEILFALGFISAAFSSMITVCQGATDTVASLFDNTSTCRRELSTAERMHQSGLVLTTLLQRIRTWAINVFLIAIAVLVIIFNEDREGVVTFAQASNGGFVLPFFCHFLFICLKDDDLMKRGPMNKAFGLWLQFCVGLTVSLASYSLLSLLLESQITRLSLAGACGVLDLFLLSFLVRK